MKLEVSKVSSDRPSLVKEHSKRYTKQKSFFPASIENEVDEFKSIFSRKGKVGDIRWEIVSDKPHFLTDLFLWCMKSSWTTFILFILVIYLLIVVIFSILYFFLGSGVTNSNSKFHACFYFSIQTMATIGYGFLAPNSDAVNIIVTLQLFVVFFAIPLITGVLYFKFSIPCSKLVFSDICCIYKRQVDQKYVLACRFALTTHTTYINSQILMGAYISHNNSVKVLSSVMQPLKLQTNQLPVFRLCFLAQHIIDESSPFWNVIQFENNKMMRFNPNYDVRCNIVVQGFDYATSQTICDFKVYMKDAILFGYQFIDILSSSSPDIQHVNMISINFISDVKECKD